LTYGATTCISLNSGFVTGGGWINSPAGAYLANPSVTGRVSFGFVAQARATETTPKGDTEVQLQGGGLDFKSTGYTVLLVSGSVAQYRGSGTLNGAGSYSFIVTVRDGSVSGGGGVDGFRIRILNSAGTVIYDNVPGADSSLTSANVQDLAGGSITIHK
jgi:hypothetical protein